MPFWLYNMNCVYKIDVAGMKKNHSKESSKPLVLDEYHLITPIEAKYMSEILCA